MEFLLKNSKVEIVEFNDKKMKGAFGENLKHIKLRIVESGSKKEYDLKVRKKFIK